MERVVGDGVGEPSAEQPSGSNLTPGRPRWCEHCDKRFLSGNQLHKHLKECSGVKHLKECSGVTAVGPRKRKHDQAPWPPLASEPETFAEAIQAPKRRRFVHGGLAGDVEAVEVGGTFFYNTAPPAPAHAHASPHRSWIRPRTTGLGHQASAATGLGHQASATTGLGHSATTGLGHRASATIPASATSSQAPATSSPAPATSSPAPATSSPAPTTDSCLIA